MQLATNTGFAEAANVGIRAAVSPYVVLLNTDTEVHPDWLSKLVTCIERAPPTVAAVSSQMLKMEDPTLIEDAGDELSWYGAATKRGHSEPAANFNQAAEVFSPCAGAAIYRRSFLEATGGFDEAFFAYLEDVDLGLRGRLMGFRYLYEPQAKLIHKGHGSGMLQDTYVELITRNRLMLLAKNVPARLLLRHAAKILYGQAYFFADYARPWASLKGYASLVALLPDIGRKRRAVGQMAIAGIDLGTLLIANPPSPSLSSLMYRRLAGLAKKLPIFRPGGSRA